MLRPGEDVGSTLPQSKGDGRGQASNSRRRWVIPFVIGVAAASLLAALGPPLAGFGPAYHYVCSIGSKVSSTILWTPLVLLNSPYGGSANASYSGFLSTGVTNGHSGGLFRLDNWSLHQSARGVAFGPGVDQGCTSRLVAVDDGQSCGQGGITATLSLGPVNLTSDRDEPTSVMVGAFGSCLPAHNPFASVDFNNSFGAENAGPLTTCGGTVGYSGDPYSAHSSDLTVLVPFNLSGKVTEISAVVPDPVNYSYSYPTTMPGVWEIDNPSSGTSFPGGGFAFEFRPCPP